MWQRYKENPSLDLFGKLIISRTKVLKRKEILFQYFSLDEEWNLENMSRLDVNGIYQHDCLDGLEKLEKKSVDVVVTSPPYNIGVDYDNYNDDKSEKDYLNWLREVFKKCKSVLSDDGSLFLNIGNKPSEQYKSFDIAQELSDLYCLQNTIHWVKSIAIPQEDTGDYQNINGDIAVGHYKPVNSKRFLNNCHEYIFHFTKEKNVEIDKLGIGVPYQDKSNIGRWKSTEKDLRDRGNIWFIPYETIRNGKKERPHPSTFPVKLPEMCIKLHGIEKTELVLDPFMGIGSTAIACKELDVDYIGFEIDEGYIDTAKERLSNFQSE